MSLVKLDVRNGGEFWNSRAPRENLVVDAVNYHYEVPVSGAWHRPAEDGIAIDN